MNPDSKPKLVSRGRLRHDPVRSADFLMLPERLVKLNKTGAAILSLCDGDLTIAEIEERLRLEFSSDNIESDVLSFLRRVLEQGWINLDGC